MRRAVVWLVVLALVGAGGFYAWGTWGGPGRGVEARRGPGGGGGRRGPGGDAPVSVLTEAARRADVPVTLEAVGTVQALNTVTVRSQVDGRLLELAFREGQDVAAGDVIARVDPTIYRAAYDQAIAKKLGDEANLANARIDLGRYINLAQTNYGSKQQADTQRAAVAQLEAQLKADEGAIDNARAYLDFTTVRAPIAGRTGIRLVDAGNIVKASDATGLVVITQVTPITVLFNLPQQNLRAVNAAVARGPVGVETLEGDGRTALDRGRLEVVDNQVDATTGTVRIKATFPNERLQLWPGAFVNVRLTVDTIADAVVVPTAAVQRGPTGPFVYSVVDDKAVLKPVTLGRQTETVTVVTAGLEPPEPVITTGFARLTDGDRVSVAAPQPAEGTAPARRGRPDGEARDPSRQRFEAGRTGAAGGQAAGGAEGRERRGSRPDAAMPGGSTPGTGQPGDRPPGSGRPATTGSTGAGTAGGTTP